MVVIGYSGHAYVVCNILDVAGTKVLFYCDKEEKSYNPLQLEYLGDENQEAVQNKIRNEKFFIAVGDNRIRRKVYELLKEKSILPVNAVHPAANIASNAKIAQHNVMISSGVAVNPLTVIGNGVICNTNATIEHECVIGDFAHIGPGAVLCGNVTVGEDAFIGAGAVVRQGIRIGKNAMVGMGAVVVKDIADGETVVGNPSRLKL